jgi:transposase
MKLARPTLEALAVERPSWLVVWPQRLCLDQGYDYPQIQELALEMGYWAHMRSRGEEAQQRQAGLRAHRWVVERTHSWLNRFRGLLIRWSKKAKNHLALLHLACGIITWLPNRLAQPPSKWPTSWRNNSN